MLSVGGSGAGWWAAQPRATAQAPQSVKPSASSLQDRLRAAEQRTQVAQARVKELENRLHKAEADAARRHVPMKEQTKQVKAMLEVRYQDLLKQFEERSRQSAKLLVESQARVEDLRLGVRLLEKECAASRRSQPYRDLAEGRRKLLAKEAELQMQQQEAELRGAFLRAEIAAVVADYRKQVGAPAAAATPPRDDLERRLGTMERELTELRRTLSRRER